MSAEDAETALASAAAAVAAAVAALPVDQLAQHQLAQGQLMALPPPHPEHDHEADTEGFNQPGDNSHLARKPRKLRKPNDVARCQVDGCGRDLSDAKLYLRRYSVCEPHFKAEWVTLSGGRFRFCQQCNKFQPLDNFTGNRRSCKARSEDRNLRRRKQRTDERAAAGDEGDGGSGAGRLVKGAPNLGGLSVPTRAALGDNGILRQLGTDPSDPNAAVNNLQYLTQMQQLFLAGSTGAGLPGIMAMGGGAGGGAGTSVHVQMPATVDLTALMVGGDLSGLGAGSSNANALSILSAAATANGNVARGVAGSSGGAAPTGAGGPLTSLTDPSVGNNVLQQLQLAQLASALSKGGAMGAMSGSGSAAAGSGGLAAALGNVGMSVGLAPGAGLAGGLHGNALTQQLLAQQASATVGGGAMGAGLNGGAAAPGAIMPLADAASFGGNLMSWTEQDLQSLMAQQLLQQTAGASPAQPVLVIGANQNVMLLSLDSLGLLQQQAK